MLKKSILFRVSRSQRYDRIARTTRRTDILFNTNKHAVFCLGCQAAITIVLLFVSQTTTAKVEETITKTKDTFLRFLLLNGNNPFLETLLLFCWLDCSSVGKLD